MIEACLTERVYWYGSKRLSISVKRLMDDVYFSFQGHFGPRLDALTKTKPINNHFTFAAMSFSAAN